MPILGSFCKSVTWAMMAAWSFFCNSLTVVPCMNVFLPCQICWYRLMIIEVIFRYHLLSLLLIFLCFLLQVLQCCPMAGYVAPNKIAPPNNVLMLPGSFCMSLKVRISLWRGFVICLESILSSQCAV